MGLRQEWEQQGLEKGLEQGLERGQRQGQAALLRELLRLEFGELSATDVARVEGASMAQLDDWAARVLMASSLDEVWA